MATISIAIGAFNHRYSTPLAFIDVATDSFSVCTEFFYVTYSIRYNLNLSNTTYYLAIVNSRFSRALFTYYFSYPSVNSVQVFYWKYQPQNPLVIGFIEHTKKYYTYEELLAISSLAHELENSYEESELVSLLHDSNLSTNGKISFVKKPSERKNIQKLDEIISEDFTISTLVAQIPNLGQQFTLSKDRLLDEISENDIIVNDDSLIGIVGRNFNNINIYCNISHTPLLIEFVEECRKNHIRLLRTLPLTWTRQAISYNNDSDLISILKVIYFGLHHHLILSIEKQKSYKKGEIPDSTYLPAQPQIINVTNNDLNVTSYKYYTHTIEPDLSLLDRKDQAIQDCAKKYLNIELYIYISNTKIDICNQQNLNNHIYYTPENPTLYVYFYNHDTIPLLIYFTNKWHSPRSKDDYFKTWTEINELSGVTFPTCYDLDKARIKDQLDKINKMLNEINIGFTSDSSYGLDRDAPPTFDGIRINVEKDTPPKLGYKYIIHSTKNKYQLGPIRHGKQNLVTCRQPITVTSNYNKLVVYYEKCDTDYKNPLLLKACLQQSEPPTSTYYQRSEGLDITSWDKANGGTSALDSEDKLLKKLIEIANKINIEIKIELDKQSKYNVFKLNGGRESFFQQIVLSEQVTVQQTCHDKASSPFKCYTHAIPDLGNHQSIKELIIYIGGDRVQTYSSRASAGTSGGCDTTGSGNGYPETIHYSRCTNKVYVYFHGDDPRPLLFFYGRCAYTPKSLPDYTSKWVTVDGLSMTSSFSSFWFVLVQKMTRSLLLPLLLLKTLKDVCNFLNPVHIDKSTTMGQTSCEYTIHQYNGDKHIKIKLKKETITSCYTKFTHTPYSGHRLGNIMYNDECVRDNATSKPITAGGYSIVTVFYKTEDKSYQYPLLISLKKNGTSGSSHQSCYELTSSSNKIYQKMVPLTTLDAKLVPILDRINYNVLMTLIIVLSRQRDYKPELINNTDRPPPEPPQLKVTKHTTTPESSYTSYTHELTNYVKLPEVGGLVFEIMNHVEIKLHSKPDTKEITGVYVDTQHIYYTKCKGSIKVYFYQHKNSISSDIGSGDVSISNTTDNVPLLFYFNEKWYSPQSKDKYLTDWIEVSELKDIPGTHYTSYYFDVKEQLDKSNKVLNRIELLREADCGIPAISGLKMSHAIKRVKVECMKDKKLFYVGYTHSTINMGPIGEINHTSSTILSGIYSTDYEKYNFNTVVVFFLKLDPNLTYPLLICLGIDNKYNLYYELESITENNKYRFTKRLESIDTQNVKEMEKKLVSILNSLSKEDRDTLYKHLKLQTPGQYNRDLETSNGLLSNNLMKTIIPVGGTYLVAGASIYPASALIHSFLALI